MSPAADPAYGSRLLWLWWQGLRDHLRGNHRRASARWGHLRPPPGSGRLVWAEAGGTEDSVRLAAGLLQALSATQRDLRLVLSFEQEYPQLAGRMLDGLRDTAYGYGPADPARAVRRTLRALAPSGVLMVARHPAPNLCAGLETTGVQCVAVHTPVAKKGRFEAAYPADREQEEAWIRCRRAGHVAPRADLMTLLVEAQVDPNFRVLLCGGQDCSVWCMLGVDHRQCRQIDAWWRASGLARRGVLLVAAEHCRRPPAAWQRISSWDRTAPGIGAVLLLDDRRWFAAAAASSDAIHLGDCDAWTFWQALAGGCPVTVSGRAAVLGRFDADSISALPADLLAEVRDLAVLERFWSQMQADPIGLRQRGDVLRRLFWGERRRAGEVSRELLDRVSAW